MRPASGVGLRPLQPRRSTAGLTLGTVSSPLPAEKRGSCRALGRLAAPLRDMGSTALGIRRGTAWLALWFNLLVRS